MNQDLQDKYSLSPIREIEWEEIYARWKKREEKVWYDHYTERGFDSWDAWRAQFTKGIQKRPLTWTLYKINRPLESVPQMFVGPFEGWMPYYGERLEGTFENIATGLDESKCQELLAVLDNLPDESLFFGIHDNEKIMTLDGSHRSVAISLAKINNLDIHPIVHIALPDFDPKQQAEFDHIFYTIEGHKAA